MNFKALTQRLHPSQSERNFRLGVVNGVLFSLADALIDASLVLALLIRELGGSQAVVGLLPSLRNGGFLLPQLLVAGRIAGMPLKLPLYRRTAIGRCLTFALMILVVWSAGALPAWLSLLLLCVTYTAYSLTGGSSSLAFQDVVAKVIPPRRRGTFFSYRQLFGGLLAFLVAGPLVRSLLGLEGPLPFPANFGTLFIISFCCIALGLLAFSLIDEPPLTQPTKAQTLSETLQSAPRLFRNDTDFRRFIVSRIWSRVGAIADPFYIVYAREVLDISPRYVGIYLSVRVLTAALSNIYWGRVSDAHGNRRLMVMTTGLAGLVPVVALILPWFAPSGSPLLAWMFTGVFLLIGLSIDGSAMAGSTYLLEIAPEAQRATYCGIANTAMGVFTFLPVLGGLLLTLLDNNYSLLFVLGGIGSFVAWGSTLRMREVRDDMRQAALIRQARVTTNK